MENKEYTKGKWEVMDWGIGTITCIKSGDMHIAQVAYCDWHTKEERKNRYELQKANAERICQCVNGWDELEEENRYYIELNNKLLKDSYELKAQRDELLKACKEIYDEMEFDANQNILDDIHQCLFNHIKQAISKCEDGNV